METAVERTHLLMQTEFQSPPPLLICGGEASSDVRAAYMSGLCAGLRFRSLLANGSFDPDPYLFTTDDAVSVEAPPFNFFPDSENFPSHHYQQLPQLRSLEPPPPHYTELGCLPRAKTTPYEAQKLSPRKRRSDQKLSEKTWRLQKLLPWNKRKMDMGTTLEEAYKYIKFLQAQTSVLQGMPICGGGDAAYSESGGGLEMLSRQQLLQVVVNSPVAQAQLYSKGCCVYSTEQMVLLKKNAERKAIFHPMLVDADTNFVMFS